MLSPWPMYSDAMHWCSSRIFITVMKICTKQTNRSKSNNAATCVRGASFHPVLLQLSTMSFGDQLHDRTAEPSNQKGKCPPLVASCRRGRSTSTSAQRF